MIVENLEILKDFIKDYKIKEFEQVGLNLRLKMEINFVDNSRLIIREITIDGEKRKYSYHWQDKNKKLICRWDNAPDWKNISTFPHHKHLKNKILPSFSIDSENIFNEIKTMFERDIHQ